MLNERQRRVGENEAIFRSVNEIVRPVEPTWIETEKVVSKHLEYWTVEKLLGLPAGIARATDPNVSSLDATSRLNTRYAIASLR